jgi:excisionase family DNA binding protein
MQPARLLGPSRYLLSPAEAAHVLNVGRSTVFMLMSTGQLESVHVGRLRRIPLDSIQAFIQRLRDREAGPAE